MNNYLHAIVSLLLLMMTFGSAVADTIEIDVKVQSIDGDGKSITASRNGKTLSLGLSNNAKISLNGRSIKAVDLPLNVTCSITYETELEAVLAITAQTEGQNADDDDSEVKFSRISLRLGKDGNCSLDVDATEEPDFPADPPGSPLAKPIVPGTSCIRLENGQTSVRFGVDVDLASALPTWLTAEQKNKASQLLTKGRDETFLVFLPGKTENPMFPYPRYIGLPCVVDIEIAGHSRGIFQLIFRFGSDVLAISLTGLNAPGNGGEPGSVTAGFRSKGEWKTLATANQRKNTVRTYDFRLPQHDERGSIVMEIATMADVPIGLKQLRVTSHLRPMFGIGLDQKGDNVFVKQVIAGGASDVAGVVVGDIVLKVSGSEAKGLRTVMQLLADQTPGEPTSILVNRFGKELQIEVTPN